jgi:hypothetical protein
VVVGKTSEQSTMKVYQAINKVQAELAKQGIGKDRKNQAQGYKFRSIDDVYNVLSSILAENNLCVLPRIISRDLRLAETKSGGSMHYVTVEAEFDFVSSEDGTKHTVKSYGEAMDSGDKATNKAMSAAHKYAMLMAFSIPTEGDNDADQAPQEVKKPTLTNSRFNNAVQKIIAKEYSVEQLRDTFTLTAEQESALVQALANA